MANPGDFASTVKQQADIVRIIGEYVKLKKAGAQNFSGLCPFHGEKTASFNVHASRQFFHCFGCGVSGDVFTFVQKIEHITFPEAVRAVAQKLGIAVPKVQFNSPQEAREAKTRAVLIDLNEAACKFFQQVLRRPEGAAAREYLKSRGLNEEAIERFRIGYAPESGFLLRDALKGMAEDEYLRESGLFSWKDTGETGANRGPSTAPVRGSAQDDSRGGNRSGVAQGQGGAPAVPPKAALYSKFRNRVMFPICNEQGKVIAFTGRTLATDEKAGPKYLNSPETPIYQKSRVLYNLHLAKEAIRQLDYVILVEGQMDCISVYNAGFHNVIASSGTAFTEIQARLLGRLTKKILINFDPDTAGANAAERSLAMLVAEDFDIRVLTLDQGFDPDLYIRKKGAEEYGKALFGAARYFDYLIERARQMFPIRSAEGKAKAINYLLPHVQRIPSRIVRDEMAADIGQKLQIDSAVLRQELRNVAGTRTAAKVTKVHEQTLTDAERLIIRALAGGHQLAYMVQDENGQEVEFDPCQQVHYTLTTERLHAGLAAEAILDALLDPANHNPAIGGVDPSSLPLGDTDRRLLATALMNEDEPITPELLHGAIEALRRRSLEARQRELKVAIADAERKGNFELLTTLLQEKLAIDRALR